MHDAHNPSAEKHTLASFGGRFLSGVVARKQIYLAQLKARNMQISLQLQSQLAFHKEMNLVHLLPCH
jgi:hypothetical protein